MDLPDDWTLIAESNVNGISMNCGHQQLGPTWIPGTAALDVILVRTDEIAIWLSGFRLTPARMSFQARALHRDLQQGSSMRDSVDTEAALVDIPSLEGELTSVEDSVLWSVPAPEIPEVVEGGNPWTTNELTIGVQFCEKWAAHALNRGDWGDGMSLSCWSASSGGGSYEADLTCSEVPDADVTFWAEWAARDVERCEVVVPSSIFTEAISRAQLLWNGPPPRHDGVQVIIS